MRASEQRVDELHRRMTLRRKSKVRRNRLIGTSAVAVFLAAALLFAADVSRSEVQFQGPNSSIAAASIFAEHEAIGFVLVALVAFCLGVLATVLCHRLKAGQTDEEPKDD